MSVLVTGYNRTSIIAESSFPVSSLEPENPIGLNRIFPSLSIINLAGIPFIL